MKLELPRHILEKNFKYQFHDILHWEPSFSTRTDGRTDRQAWES